MVCLFSTHVRPPPSLLLTDLRNEARLKHNAYRVDSEARRVHKPCTPNSWSVSLECSSAQITNYPHSMTISFVFPSCYQRVQTHSTFVVYCSVLSFIHNYHHTLYTITITLTSSFSAREKREKESIIWLNAHHAVHASHSFLLRQTWMSIPSPPPTVHTTYLWAF